MTASVFFLFLLAACLLCTDTADGLLLHGLAAAVTTSAILSLPTGFVPKRIRWLFQLLVFEPFVCVCLTDCYCQTFFLSPITPQILSSIILTNQRETAEFFSDFLTSSILHDWRLVSLLLLTVLFHACLLKREYLWRWNMQERKRWYATALYALPVLCAIYEVRPAYHYAKTFCSSHDPMQLEGLIFRHYHEEIPTPLHRAAFACYALSLSAQTLEGIKKVSFGAAIEHCTHLSPHITLIIGESYNKHHSSLYGYGLPTTPRQHRRRDNGELFVFNDVVSPWNITSNAFLNIFSLWECNSTSSISSYPLFPILFRRASYDVTFFSNQYQLRGFRKGATNQAGHFFLADTELSDSLFTYRNSRSAVFDMRLVSDFSAYKRAHPLRPYTLDIIHLVGQHFTYDKRYPRSESFFSSSNYAGRGLDREAREVVMHYDNATRYNDRVLDSLLTVCEEEESIVIFLSDHGEEVYDDTHVHGRLFREPTAADARNEYEIPMWIWCSDRYLSAHKDVVEQIKASVDKPFMTDGIPQLLLYLAGIRCQWERQGANILSPSYHCKPRLICSGTDYDKLLAKPR